MYNKHKIYAQRANNPQNKSRQKKLKKQHKHLIINEIKLIHPLYLDFKLRFLSE